MDIYDRASELEQFQREMAIQSAREEVQTDPQAEICRGCDFATERFTGRDCDCWRDCLYDWQKQNNSTFLQILLDSLFLVRYSYYINNAQGE